MKKGLIEIKESQKRMFIFFHKVKNKYSLLFSFSFRITKLILLLHCLQNLKFSLLQVTMFRK